MTEHLWDINDLAEYLKVCRRSAEKLAASERFPRPVRVTSRQRRWVPEEVQKWVRTAR